MKTFRIVLVVVFILALASCANSPQKAVVGKWIGPEGSEFEGNGFEFQKDGVLIIMNGDESIQGSYSFKDDTHLTMTIQGDSVDITMTLGESEITLDHEGDAITLKRATDEEWAAAASKPSPMKIDAYNASAQSAGRNAKLAEEVYYQNNMNEQGVSNYTNKLSTLLELDKNLADDPEVSWAFGACDSSGYTFTTWHARGNTTFTFTD